MAFTDPLDALGGFQLVYTALLLPCSLLAGHN